MIKRTSPGCWIFNKKDYLCSSACTDLAPLFFLRTIILFPFPQIPPPNTLSWPKVASFRTHSNTCSRKSLAGDYLHLPLQGLSEKRETGWWYIFYRLFQRKHAKCMSTYLVVGRLGKRNPMCFQKVVGQGRWGLNWRVRTTLWVTWIFFCVYAYFS